VLLHGDHALAAYCYYLVVNVTFNTCLTLLTGRGSAILGFLSLKIAVPLTAIMAPLPWPLIGPQSVRAYQWAVLVVIISGVAAFQYGTRRRLKAAEPATGTGLSVSMSPMPSQALMQDA